MDPEIELAAVLQAGLTPDVMLLQLLGKALPAPLQATHREAVLVLQAVRGLTRAPGSTADRLAFCQRLDAVARGAPATGFAAEWDGVVDSFRNQGLMAAELLQAAQRELAMLAAGQTVLFPAWSDFYNHARFALVPVGRALLQAAGRPERSDGMDALMTALALTAALQDTPARYRRGGLVGIPLQWLTAEGLTPAALAAPRSTKAVHNSFARGVARLRELLGIARAVAVPPALEPFAAAAIFALQRLARRIERSDPLARPVRLSLLDRLALRFRHRI